MESMHTYIESVKRATGHSKVKLIARCFGTNLLATYFATYGWDDIASVLIYNPVMNGTLVTDALFTGEIEFDTDQLDYFATQELGDDELMSFLKIYITFVNKLKQLGIPVYLINKMMSKLVPLVLPDVLKVSYGTMPGYWAMVSSEKYEKARDYVFSSEEDKIKFAGLIEKLDNYHNVVGKNIPDILKQIEEDGIPVSIVAKFGMQGYPISKECDTQSDQIISAQQQGMGTTATNIGKTFSKEYIAKAIENDTDKYISPDKTIDASTGLFPERTWYIKGCPHNDFPYLVDMLLYKIVSNPQMTVWDNPDYPQYTVFKGKMYQDESLTPMTDDNLGNTHKTPNIFKVFFEVVVKFFELIKALIKGDLAL